MGIEQAQNLCGKGKRAERKWVIEGKLKGERNKARDYENGRRKERDRKKKRDEEEG